MAASQFTSSMVRVIIILPSHRLSVQNSIHATLQSLPFTTLSFTSGALNHE
jgi:hypothetical protein